MLAGSLGALAKPAILYVALLALVAGCQLGPSDDAKSSGSGTTQVVSAQDNVPIDHAPLQLLGRTELPDYTGDFDHFAADVAGNRLFLDDEDGGTLEVFALDSGEHLKMTNNSLPPA